MSNDNPDHSAARRPPPPPPAATRPATGAANTSTSATTGSSPSTYNQGGRSSLTPQSSTQAKVDLAAMALRLRDEQIEAKVIYFGADQKTNKELDAITDAVVAELMALQKQASQKAHAADQKETDLEIELIGNLRTLLEKLFSSRRENFLRRKIEDISRRISTLFFNSELFAKISATSTETRTFAWSDQAVYYALLKNKDALAATLRGLSYADGDGLKDALDRLASIEKGLRMEYLHHTTPELEKLLVIFGEELARFFFQEFTTNLGEFCWEVIRESRVARGKPHGYKLGPEVFQAFREVFDKKFLERLVLNVQEPIVRRASEARDTFREDTVRFVASPQIFSEICSVIADAVYDYLHTEGFLDLPAQWRAHLYRQETHRG